MHERLDVATLTAYALGELSERERVEVEALLARSPEARRELTDIEATAALLREALAEGPRLTLTDAQRAAVENEARQRKVLRFSFRRVLLGPGALAAAASLAAVALLSWHALRLRGEGPPRPGATPAAGPVVSERALTSAPTMTEAPSPVDESDRGSPGRVADAAGRPNEPAVARPGPVHAAAADSATVPSLGEPIAPPSGNATTEIARPAPRVIALPTPEPTGGMTGMVVDASNGGIVGAEVTIANVQTYAVHRTRTGLGGGFSISGLPVGEYRATVEQPGFKPTTRGRIAVAAGKARNIGTMRLADGELAASAVAERRDVPGSAASAAGSLQARGTLLKPKSTGELWGRVNDRSKAAVASALVTLVNQATDETSLTCTDADGVYGFTGLAPGLYRLAAERPGFIATTESGIRVSAARAAAFDLRLAALRSPLPAEGEACGETPARRPGGVRLEVTDPTGAAVTEVRVRLLNEATGVTRKGSTGKRGERSFSRLPPGRYTLSAEKAGFKPWQMANVAVAAGDPRLIRVQLSLPTITE